MLTLKKQGKLLELPLQLYADGIRKVKLRLLELHPEYDCIVNNVYKKFSIKMELIKREGKSLIVESVPKNKLMILKDKKICSDPFILTTSWSKILGAELTLRGEDCKKFWNELCLERSKKLWFPTEIDCVDLPLTSLNGFCLKTIQNSWFCPKQNINPVAKNSPKTFCPSFKFSHVEKWEKEGINALRIKLLPTEKQKQIFEKWAGTARYVYNKCLEKIKLDPSLNSVKGYSLLRDENITAKNNSSINAWELETPKDIRNGALRDIKKAYVTAWANLKNGNIRSFGLNNRLKKKGHEQSMEIPNTAIKLIKKGNNLQGLKIYSRYIQTVIKIDRNSVKGYNISEIEKYARLKKENNQWYLCISYDVAGIENENKEKTCAIDPGIRKFATIYSEDKVIQIIPDSKKIHKIYNTLDTFQRLKDNGVITAKIYNKKRCRLQARLKNLVDDLHYKTAKFLTDNYSNILLPSFETQDMVRGMLHKRVKRDMLNFSFYKFKTRLMHKASFIKHCNVEIVNEAYTSQTCGFCGNLKKTSDEKIRCCKCNQIFDRDINGARNIYLKYIKQ